MQVFTVFSAVEQVAGHLRRELRRGEWSGAMPGVNPVVAEMGVNHKTVEAALRMLEDEGLPNTKSRRSRCSGGAAPCRSPGSARIMSKLGACWSAV